MGPSLTAATDDSQKLDLVCTLLQQVLAKLELQPVSGSSPWLPLRQAANALHYSSPRALRMAINRGRIPSQFVRSTVGKTGRRRTLYVDVEGFASHLRDK